MDDHRVDPAQASTLQRVLELALESCRSVIEGDAIVEAADPADGLAPSYVPFTGTRKRPTLVCREKLSRGTRCNATPKRASLHPTPYHAAVPRSSVLERDARFVSHAQRAPSHRSASRTYRPAVPHGGWCMPWRKVISRSRQCREARRQYHTTTQPSWPARAAQVVVESRPPCLWRECAHVDAKAAFRSIRRAMENKKVRTELRFREFACALEC